MIRDVMLLAEIVIMVAWWIRIYVGSASAGKRVELAPSAKAGRSIPASEIKTSVQPPRLRKPSAIPKPMQPGTASESLFELNKRFFDGRIGAKEYLDSRRDLTVQLQAGPREVKKTEAGEIGEGDLEILRLVGEKKTALEIAIMLMKDPEEASRKIDGFIREGYLRKDMSLTEKGAKKVFGKREVQSRKIEG